MVKIKDGAGREWNMTITIADAKRIRDEMEIDLCQLNGPPDLSQSILAQLVIDPILLVDLTYRILRSQADAAGLDDAQYGRQWMGDSIRDLRDGFFESLVNFYPSPAERGALKNQINQMTGAAMLAAETMLKTTPTSETADRLRDLFGNLFTAARAESG